MALINNIDYAPIIYTVGYIFTILSLSSTKVITLRVFYWISTLDFIIYGMYIGKTEIILWSLFAFAVNSYQLICYPFFESTLFFSEAQLSIYNKVFRKYMLPGNFRQLIKIAKDKSASDITLIKENSENKDLYLIYQNYNAKIIVTHSGKEIAQLPIYSFVGDMSFISGCRTTCTVQSHGDISYYHWSGLQLERLKERDIDTYNKLLFMVSYDLVQKIIKSSPYEIVSIPNQNKE